jgi:hypothetical protein
MYLTTFPVASRMSVLTHKTYYPQVSTDLVLQPRLAEQLGLNPMCEMSLPQDVEDTFFRKEQPCQIVLTHLVFDAILYFVEIRRRKKNNDPVIQRSMRRDHLAEAVFESWGQNLYDLVVVQFGLAFFTSIVHNVCVNNACKKSYSKIGKQDHKDVVFQCWWVGPKIKSGVA